VSPGREARRGGLMERIRRVHHPTVPGTGSVIVLDPDETHHVVRVLRLRSGDRLSVFDGRGREWEAVLLSADGPGATVRATSELTGRVDPVLPVTLFQALSRPERMEFLIQKGTEVGLAAIRPFTAHRSEAGDPSSDRLRRYRRVALEAAKQSGRRSIPEVADPIAALPAPPDGVRAFLLDGGAGSRPLAEHAGHPRPAAVWLAVGPEGGFEPDEAAALEGSGWRRVRLGPRTLRTETAGIVAAALVLHVWDDLGPPLGDG
jgi:16S rRNA (uracil1498-N3)-methyltransferase